MFEKYCQKAREINVDQGTQLKLYGLFKQATIGDNNTTKPGFLQYRERVKWDAWAECKGIDKEEAKSLYIQLVASVDESGDSIREPTGKGWVNVSMPMKPIESTETNINDWIKQGDLEKIKQNVKNHFALDEMGLAPIHWAVDANQVEITKYLLEQENVIDLQDADGNTPLHYACMTDNPEMVKLLLDNGARTDLRNADGESIRDVCSGEIFKSFSTRIGNIA